MPVNIYMYICASKGARESLEKRKHIPIVKASMHMGSLEPIALSPEDE